MRSYLVGTLLAVMTCPLCAQHSEYADPKLTHGATDSKVTQATVQKTICRPGYTATVRNVTAAEKKEVMRRYGLPPSELPNVEIDHLISLEIGGSNDPANLWPQYYEAAEGQADYLGARAKDVVETHLHREVCEGKLALVDAQRLIVKQWTIIYQSLQKDKK